MIGSFIPSCSYTHAYTYITIIYVYRYVPYTHSMEESRGLLRARPYAPRAHMPLFSHSGISHMPLIRHYLYPYIAIAHTLSEHTPYGRTPKVDHGGVYVPNAITLRGSPLIHSMRIGYTGTLLLSLCGYALMVYVLRAYIRIR